MNTNINENDNATKPKTPLTVELVPSTCWFFNVRSEVSKEDWDTLKKITSEKAGARCEICGGRGPRWPVECHEIWHYDDEKHIQTLTGLIALCPACHEVKHLGLSQTKGRYDQALAHLARINGWSLEDAALYAEVQFEVHARRSNHQWDLDISWLNNLGINVPNHARKAP